MCVCILVDSIFEALVSVVNQSSLTIPGYQCAVRYFRKMIVTLISSFGESPLQTLVREHALPLHDLGAENRLVMQENASVA